MGRRKSAGRRAALGMRRRAALGALVAAAIAVAAAAGIAATLVLTRDSGGPSAPKAAIVDQLTLTQPNPSFAEETTRLLENAGYAVDYYSGEQVTVDFYRSLPEHGYDLIVLRAHSARVKESDRVTMTEEVAIFSGEAYDATKYLDEQYSHRLNVARHHESTGNETFYFAIGPDFIRESMKGRFNGTTVIMMGCDGLSSGMAAEAFVEKGARAMVSWSGPVSAGHTDAATGRLLQHLIADRVSTQEAVAMTAAEVGPDPSYGSSLLVYPPTSLASR